MCVFDALPTVGRRRRGRRARKPFSSYPSRSSGWVCPSRLELLAKSRANWRMISLDAADVVKMGVDPANPDLINRGSSYRFDTFPVGGARIWGNWTDLMRSSTWPGRNSQDNLHVPY